MHFARPAEFTLYDASKDAPWPEHEANAAKDDQLPVVYEGTFFGDTFKEIAHVVVNGEGVVEVMTKSHPAGELIGLVQMHKSYR